jgi:Putative addiction module component.
MKGVNVQLSFEQLEAAVKQLSPVEKLKLNDSLWSENFTIPEEHKAIVRNRRKKSTSSPERLISWDKALKKLKA